MRDCVFRDLCESVSMFQQYRYISGRILLGLPKLDRCQLLPPNTWTSAEHLWHVVFISHRWGSQNDPDPSGSQLTTLKQLVLRIAEIAEVISDERVGIEAARDRLARVPSLKWQGTLQAAHLVFRSLCAAEPVQDTWKDGSGALDVIGFWYDYSCLPQDPKTTDEELEFAQTLQGIGDMLLSPQVSTLVLRKDGDGYLSRGWCFAESMIALSKSDTNMPLVLRTDRWAEPFSVFNETTQVFLLPWEDTAGAMTGLKAFFVAIEATFLQLVARSGGSTSEFALAPIDTVTIGSRLLAHIQPWLMVLPEGGHLNLAEPLASLLQSQGLGCRDLRDNILVALLVLKSLTSKDAVRDVAIWREALARCTKGLPLGLTRRDGNLVWQS